MSVLPQHQVKQGTHFRSKGHPIDPSVIEAVLHALPELLECAIVGIPSIGFEGAMVCCAYAPAPGAEPRVEYLRAALSDRLPTYMLPVAWMRYEKLPRTPGGKLCRTWLAERFRRSEALLPETTPAQVTVSAAIN